MQNFDDYSSGMRPFPLFPVTGVDGKKLGEINKFASTKYRKCLHHSNSCDNPAIAAHSIQNSRAMSIISEENHVYGIGIKLHKYLPIGLEFQTVGKNIASTFTGLCSNHDTSLFLPIDNLELSLKNPEQLFLMSYRSIMHEFHTCLSGLNKIQKSNNPLLATDQLTEFHRRAMFISYFKETFYDDIIESRQFSNIDHLSFTIRGQTPNLAASSFFSVGTNKSTGMLSCITLNITPVDRETTHVIASFPKCLSRLSKKYLRNIFTKTGNQRLLSLSNSLIRHGENFFLRISHVNSMTDAKKQRILSANSSVWGHEPTPLDPGLMIF